MCEFRYMERVPLGAASRISSETPAAYFLPRTLRAFDDPGLPLPSFLMSMPLYLLIIIAKFTDPKR